MLFAKLFKLCSDPARPPLDCFFDCCVCSVGRDIDLHGAVRMDVNSNFFTDGGPITDRITKFFVTIVAGELH